MTILALDPARYHGHQRRAPFFEGWYYKLVSADEAQCMAIIPGVIKGAAGHAFVQVLDGVSGQMDYYTYPLEQFWASRERFEIHVGPNRFDLAGLHLDLPGGAAGAAAPLTGTVRLSGVQGWPITPLAPGIMGPFAWTPWMETYHGVLGFDHALSGSLQRPDARYDFDGGRGYLEKDWGRSFPDAWVWFQTNHFDTPGVCLTASVAVIPWLGSSFRGFIIGLWRQGELIRFATYSGARSERLAISTNAVHWIVRDRRLRLELTARRLDGRRVTPLLGPTTTEMGKRVVETLDGMIEVRLTDRRGRLLFAETGHRAGLEIQGNLPRLQT